MSIVIHSAITLGLQVVPLTIEAALGSGFAGVQLLGLPHDYARDAKERIRAAIESLGISLPARRLIVSVRPSELLKPFKAGLEHLDLPCTIAILAALAEMQTPPKMKSGQSHLKNMLPLLRQSRHFFAGHLTLCGEILPLESSLPFELLALQEFKENSLFWFCPHPERRLSFPSSSMRCIVSLSDCVSQLQHNSSPVSAAQFHHTQEHRNLEETPSSGASSLSDTHFQRLERIESTFRKFERCPALALAMCIAAAGKHHLLLAGSPGCGKTFALRQFKHLLPPLTEQERMEVALIHGRAPAHFVERPFRNPHHSASGAALLGGSQLQPGEVTLSHHGILFLDELAEFPRPALESLREPLDEQKISLSRAKGRIELPAKFLLTAATNPCPCGYYFSRTEQCRCKVGSPQKYQQKLSGPLLERFDILLLVDHLLELPEWASPQARNSNLSPLTQGAMSWMEALLKNPEEWILHFMKVQESAWQSSGEKQPLHLSPELSALATQKAWSTRKTLRIQNLYNTLSNLFPDSSKQCLHPDTKLIIAEELRHLETTLQFGVCDLTAFAGASNLKKNAETHDNISCHENSQGSRRRTLEEEFSNGQDNLGGG